MCASFCYFFCSRSAGWNTIKDCIRLSTVVFMLSICVSVVVCVTDVGGGTFLGNGVSGFDGLFNDEQCAAVVTPWITVCLAVIEVAAALLLQPRNRAAMLYLVLCQSVWIAGSALIHASENHVQLVIYEFLALGVTIGFWLVLLQDSNYWTTLSYSSQELGFQDSDQRWSPGDTTNQQSRLDLLDQPLVSALNKNLPLRFPRLVYGLLHLGERFAGGATANVRRCTYSGPVDGQVRSGRKQCAAKEFFCDDLTEEVEREISREAMVTWMLQAGSEHIVAFYGSCVVPPYVYLIYEYCDKGSLFDVLYASARPLSLRERVQIALQAATAVSFLHNRCSPSLVHRDIKSLNYLVQSFSEEEGSAMHDVGPFKVKLADFGETIPVDQCPENPELTGSMLWMSPEAARKERYTIASDVYSLASVVWETVARKQPWVRYPYGNDVERAVLDGELPYESNHTGDPKGDIVVQRLWDMLTCAWGPAESRPQAQDLVDELERLVELFDDRGCEIAIL
eukprot:TRINITY_DN17711_c0_g4_i1.p1 TRINITY_DN17711_c0_g4~~TRINITY_DN17711_c0_g4_i1.p1  ORF type:complete len:509 (+),score=59.27 TRINITY_DN17711_c0_g4_i1:272-1798(+)